MPWKEMSIMDQRQEFVHLASCEGANIRQLCRRFQISPTTGYKWLARQGATGLADQSRRPHHTPARCVPAIEEEILAARQVHPTWGARKIKRLLEDQGLQGLPAASTVHTILMRHGQISQAASQAHQPWRRFEHAAPNDLWQLDFKGHFPLERGRCHALTMLDDHSRYGLCVGALSNEGFESTQQQVMHIFRRYGLPRRMTMDNGSPWGERGRYTRFELWLMRLDIEVSHSRPYHPQTQGKDERFHRTLKAEVLQGRVFRDLLHAQHAFDTWLPIYNHLRPHEALGMATPMTRYEPSNRSYPEKLPELEYGSADQVRKVQGKGEFSYCGKEYPLGQAFTGSVIAVRHTVCEEVKAIYYGRYRVACINLKQQTISIEKTRLK